MDWLALLTLLLPLIEALLRLFSGNKDPNRRLIRRNLDRCNAAAKGAKPTNKRGKGLLARLARANALADRLGV